MKRRNYIFTNKKHPMIAIMATILGIIGILSMAFAVIYSFISDGDIPTRFGMAGAITMLYAFVGEILALYSYKLSDKFYLFSTLGTVFNAITLLASAFVLWIAN